VSKEISPRLGKGLEALIPRSLLASGKTILQVAIAMIETNPYQPRLHFSEEQLASLTASIKTFGVNQPILVRRFGDKYQIIAGERRFRASVAAGLDQVPVIVKNVSDEDMLKLALIENIERADLNPIEIAKGYQRLIEEFAFTHQGIATLFVRSRSGVTNTIRLLNLPEHIQEFIHTGILSEGHGRALLSADVDMQDFFANEAISKKWSVRELEQAVLTRKEKPLEKNKEKISFVDLESSLRSIVAVPVKISGSRQKGSISLKYASEAEFEALISRFSTF
jgi:ParB family transcriptional regulator, chromosome partitioning protein